MRLIDADELMDKICRGQCNCEYKECGNEGDCLFEHYIFWSPTISPHSNIPLTLDELREMDGEPVFIKNPEYWDCWALVQVRDKIMLTLNNGATFQAELEFKCGGKAYRRKPEEEPQ